MDKNITVDVDQCNVDRGRIILAAVVRIYDERVPLDVLEVDLFPQNHLPFLRWDFLSTLNEIFHLQ